METTVKQFSPDQFGQRVGWVGIRPVEPVVSRPFTEINVAVATVGKEGARIAFCGRPEDPLYAYDSVTGFLAASALRIVVDPDTDSYREMYTVVGRGSSNSPELPANILIRDGLNNPLTVLREDVEWADGDRVMPLLAEGLAEHGLEGHYPALYYWLNHLTVHQDVSPQLEGAEIDLNDNLMPDVSMAEATQAELSLAKTIAQKLEEAREEDTVMRKRLDVFSDIPKHQIPQEFTASRRRVKQLERGAQTAADRLHFKPAIYMSIGSPARGGRSAPYMDALAQTDSEAFGDELEELEAGKVDRSSKELRREIAELDARSTFAGHGVMSLCALSTAEMKVRDAAQG